MNGRLRFAVVALLAVAAAAPLSALDFGGVVDNRSSLEGSQTAAFAQDDKLALWLSISAGQLLEASIQGSYTFSLERPYLFDLERLRVTLRPGLAGAVTLGRFTHGDFTGWLLSHTLDGLSLTYNLPAAVMSLEVATSALLLKPVSQIQMSRSDAADLSFDNRLLAPARLVGGLQILFPEIVAGQQVNLGFWVQRDLRPDSQLIAPGEVDQYPADAVGGRLHSVYLGAGLSGSILAALYYDGFFYAEGGSELSYVADPSSPTGSSYQYRPLSAVLAGGGLRLYLERLLFTRVGMRFLYASGDADAATYLEGNTAGAATTFVPISRQTVSLVFDPQLGNLMLGQLSYSMRPFGASRSRLLQNLQLQLSGLGFFRPTTGPISERGLDPAATTLYLGTEVDGAINFRPFSDLGLALSAGVWIPNQAAFTAAAALPRMLGRLEVSFSF